MPTVDVTKIASALNLDKRRVQQLVKEGMPRASRGKYDRDKCTGWYVRYLQTLVEKKAIIGEGGEVFKNEREERLRLLRADADLREIELARERSQLVAVEDVEHEMSDLILDTKATILAVGARVAPKLVGETSRVMIQAVIEKAHKESLAYLARARVN